MTTRKQGVEFRKEMFGGGIHPEDMLFQLLSEEAMAFAYKLEKEGLEVHCIKKESEDNQGDFMLFYLIVETEQGKCNCGKCKENILKYLGGRHFVLHSEAGQLIYKGHNVPVLEQHKKEMKGKEIQFKLNKAFVIAQ